MTGQWIKKEDLKEGRAGRGKEEDLQDERAAD